MNDYKKDVYFEALVESQLSHKENILDELERAEAVSVRIMKLLMSPIEMRVYLLATNNKTIPWQDIAKELHITKGKAVWYMEKVRRRLSSFQRFLENF